MEIYFKHNQITDFGKALLETLQQKKYYDPKLLIRVSNFLKSYPAISEQIDALNNLDLEDDLRIDLSEALGYTKLAQLMEEYVGKPVLARAGIYINPVSQDELPDNRGIDVYFTGNNREFVIDRPLHGSIMGNVQLSVQSGSFFIMENNQTVHLSGDADVTLSGIHAVASGNSQLELTCGSCVKVCDQVKVKSECDSNYIEVTGGHPQIEGRGFVVVVQAGAPSIEAKDALVVTQTATDAQVKPLLDLGKHVTWLYQSNIKPDSVAPTIHQIQVKPQDGVMERVIEQLRASAKEFNEYLQSYKRVQDWTQVKLDLILLLPNNADFCKKVRAARDQTALIKLLPPYLPQLAKAGLNAQFLKTHFDTTLLERGGIYTETSAFISPDSLPKHFFGAGLYTYNHDTPISSYEKAIVLTDGSMNISAHGDSLVLARNTLTIEADGQSSVIADMTVQSVLKEGSFAAIDKVTQAVQSGYSSLLCGERLSQLFGKEHAVTCFRSTAPEDHEPYQGKVFEKRPGQPDCLFDVHTEACYYASPAMLFKENQIQYQNANETTRDVSAGRGR